MKLKVYLLRVAVGISAFVFGISLFGAGQYLKSFFQPKKIEVVAAQPAPKQEVPCVPTVVPATEPVAETEEANEWEFDGSGEYYIPDKQPKEFKDFSIMSITVRDYENTSDENPYGNPIPPEGFVQATKKHKFTRISVSNKQIAFETEAKKGISYKFSGALKDEWEFDDKVDASIVLTGSLTKLRDGKKISKIKVRFALDNSCGC